MRKTTVVLGSGLLALMLCFAPAGAEWISVDGGGPGVPEVELISHTPAATTLDVTVHGFYVEEALESGTIYHQLSFGDNAALRTVGRPELPVVTSLVGIPDFSNLKVTMEVLESTTLEGYYVWPAQELEIDGEGAPTFVIDKEFYNSNATYPKFNAVVGEPQIWRDVRLTRLEVRPISYDVGSGELTVATKMRVRVEYFGTNTIHQFTRTRRPIDPEFQKLYRGAVINFDQLGYTLDSGGLDNPGTKWLLVCKEEAVPYVQPLLDFRNAQGYEAECRTIAADFDTPEEIKAYITQLYTAYDLEYVMIVGDAYYSGGPTAVDVPMYYWVDSYSDSWYTMMDGAGDYLADLAIGRIVYDTMTDLEHQITKTMDYLTAPEVSNWAEHTLLVAHSEQYPQKYTLCKEQIRTYPYAIQVPIFGTAYGGAGATNQDVINYLNTNSSGILNYRGHGSQTAWWQWGPTGDFNATHIMQLTNYDRYFVHFDVCCDNMDFPGYAGDCFAESMMKAPAASVAIHSAIIPSYTIPNHDYDKEFYKAIYDLSINHIGYATNFANVTVYQLHGTLGESNIRTYLWMGDACIDAWTNTMQTMTVNHPLEMYIGTSTLTVSVGFEGALVCAQNSEVYASGYTDATGSITLEFDPGPVLPGTLTLSVSAHNYLTYQMGIDVIPAVGPYVIYNNCSINDAVMGNNNGQWDFGETIDLSIEVKNVGVENANNVNVTIDTDDLLVTILDGSEPYGNINSGDSLTIADGFRVEVDPSVEDQHIVVFALTATAGPESWESFFTLIANAPEVAIERLVILDPLGNNNGQLDPGENTDFELTVSNDGHSAADNVVGILSADDPGVTVTGNPGNFGNIDPSASAMVSFDVSAEEGMPSGTIVTFTLDVVADGGYTALIEFDLVVGDERNLPTGPDNHGYWAWDNNDGGQSNPYNWIEIAPSQGGPGSTFGVTSDDDTEQQNLPFTFYYYGQSFTQISVCSNGWMAMGYVTESTYSNYGIPNASGPPNMIAPFWDDLYPVTGQTEVATYHNSAEHYYVIEWYNIGHYGATSTRETFEVILYDPAFYPTLTGDGIIEVQYNLVSNASSATFGIENASENDGIQYGYNGDYDPHAWEVEAERTITYTTGSEGGQPELTLELTYVSGSPVPAGGGDIYYDLYIENVGTAPANFDAWIDVIYEYGAPVTILQRYIQGFAPGWIIDRPRLSYPVPGGYAGGNYKYVMKLGEHPDLAYVEDSFEFVKEGAAVSGFVPFYPAGLPDPWDQIITGTELALPTEYEVLGVYPNPFNPTSTISYALPEAGRVSLKIYDVNGRLVRNLIDGYRDAGIHNAAFDASGMASGIYVYRLRVGDFTATGKMVLMK